MAHPDLVGQKLYKCFDSLEEADEVLGGRSTECKGFELCIGFVV